MKMKFPIILCFLLANAACVPSVHFYGEDFSGTEDDLALQTEEELSFCAYESGWQNGQKIRGLCSMCKRIIKNIKGTGADLVKEEIETRLLKVCSRMNRLKSVCKRVVRRYKEKLVDELLTHDGPNRACKKIRLCRRSPLHERV